MKITYYGHACFLLETMDNKILFDPFISPNVLAKEIDVDAIEADYILLSHGHEDHVADAESIARRTGATIVAAFEITTWYGQKGIEALWPMNLGGQKQFSFGLVKFVNAVHSSVLPDGTYGGNPGGFVIENEEGCIYFAGDTALSKDMELIRDRFQLDWAILPIGDNFTMGVDDAIQACNLIGCDRVLGMHYDTFPYIEIDKDAAEMSFKKAKKELVLLEIGAERQLN